jgi:colicin import membrane protein
MSRRRESWSGRRSKLWPAARAAVLAACAGWLVAMPAGVNAGEPLLPQYDLAALQQPEVARAALADLARATEALNQRAAADRQACYQRFAVNACLYRVESARREHEQRLQWIRVEANRVLREQRAVRLNERLAEAAAQQRGWAGAAR